MILIISYVFFKFPTNHGDVIRSNLINQKDTEQLSELLKAQETYYLKLTGSKTEAQSTLGQVSVESLGYAVFTESTHSQAP